MMRRPARTLTLIALALLLALTSQSLAVARGQTRAGEAVVICSGGGAVTLTLDAQGNPTGPAHLCPDMALAFFAALDLPPMTLPARVARAERAVLPPRFAAASQGTPAPQARGPPAPV